ncbi:hypothetical protein [Sphaerimonospora thailandensis]|nr:hypothetical protein [Sphaerimonospora thailandensis]
MTSPSHGTRRRRPVLVPVAAALAAAGIGVTAALGGLKEAPPEKPPHVTPGQVIDQGQFRTEFLEAVDTTEQGSFGVTRRYLEILVKVTNLGKETAFVGVLPKSGDMVSRTPGFAGSILRVTPAIKSKYDPLASVVSYGIKSQLLHPGITTTVVVKYELEPAQQPPSSITVDVGKFVYERISDRHQTYYWQIVPKGELPTDAASEGEFIIPAIAAQVSLPVRQEQT